MGSRIQLDEVREHYANAQAGGHDADEQEQAGDIVGGEDDGNATGSGDGQERDHHQLHPGSAARHHDVYDRKGNGVANG